MAEQVEHQLDALGVRDVDAETSKPKLEKADGTAKTAAVINPPKDGNKPTNKVKHPTPTGAADILHAYAAHCLEPTIFLEPNEFIPSALQMYEILHTMNNKVGHNQILLKMSQMYHPLLIRLYFGILFLVQTLRCMNYANRISASQKTFLTRFLRHYPAETLVIPGPLLPVFTALSCAQSRHTAYQLISPFLPQELGNQTRQQRLTNENAHSTFLPQVHLILSLLTQLRNTNANDQFDQRWNPMPNLPVGDNHVAVCGHDFHAGTEDHVKWSLTSPGIAHAPEVAGQTSRNTRDILQISHLPQVVLATDCRTIGLFTQLQTNDMWFADLLDGVRAFSMFFTNCGTLADCPPSGSSAILVRTHAIPKDVQLALPAGLFPGGNYAQFEYRHQAHEAKHDPSTSKLGMLAKVNLTFPETAPAPWTNAGSQLLQHRRGQYFDRNVEVASGLDYSQRQLSSVVETFYLSRPNTSK